MVCVGSLLTGARAALAWGDEGHEVIGLIADHYLTPTVRARVQSLLAADDTGLVPKDIAHEATWADKYRDSDRDTTKVRYYQTRSWHFVDLEIEDLDLNRACYGRAPLAAGTDASGGPADDCVIDKIDQFSEELKSSRTGERERRLALQFLLHLVGDLHQPLHASDDHDQGGNRKIARLPAAPANNLHHDWDTEFVARLGSSGTEIAQKLIGGITDAERTRWARGTATDWALESYAVGKAHAYGLLPAPNGPADYALSDQYVSDATAVTAEQLSKAGVRLAFVLNQALDAVSQ
jgi:hypothetical protein